MKEFILSEVLRTHGLTSMSRDELCKLLDILVDMNLYAIEGMRKKGLTDTSSAMIGVCRTGL